MVQVEHFPHQAFSHFGLKTKTMRGYRLEDDEEVNKTMIF